MPRGPQRIKFPQGICKGCWLGHVWLKTMDWKRLRSSRLHEAKWKDCKALLIQSFRGDMSGTKSKIIFFAKADVF